MSDFYERLKHSSRINLNKGQREAVGHLEGPCLTLAVPGSGKTTMLLCRTLHLQETHRIPAGNILSLTFSKAAAEDMKTRYQHLFGSAGQRPFFSTIHGFSYGLIRGHLSSQSLPEPKLLADGAGDRNRLLLQIAREIPGVGTNDEKLEEIGNRISYFKNMMITPEEAGEHLPEKGWQTEIPRIYKTYEFAKKKHHLMDFDDMLSTAYDILTTNPEKANQLHNRYPFVQVDESQDTSKIQHALIRSLLGPQKNLFMVADDDQSIYGFRGAFPEMILSFKKEYPAGRLYHLSENYRSAPQIIDVCTSVIANNEKRFKKQMNSAINETGEVHIVDYLDVQQRNEALIDSLNTRNETSVGILYRNNLSAVSVANSLLQAGIDFQIKDSSGSFFEHWVVRDLNDILNFALFRQDLELFERIYYKMNGFISKDWMNQGKNAHRGGSVLKTLLDRTQPAKRQRDNILAMENLLDRIAGEMPSQAIHTAAYELGYYDFMIRRCDQAGLSKDTARTVLDTLIQLSLPHRTAASFFSSLEELKTTLRTSRAGSGAQVHLSTIHGAKGLEYDRVILLDIDKGTLPSSKALEEFEAGETAAYEEERRLFYVGVSRARTRLDLYRVKFRNGARLYPSPFVAEMTAKAGVVKITDLSQNNKTGSEHLSQSNSSQTLLEGQPLAAGDPVVHMKFGRGQIVDINEDSLTIQFSDTTRTLSKRLCLEKGLISR